MGVRLVMSGIHADTSMKSEGGLGSAWFRRQWDLHTGYISATGAALGYQIVLELLEGDWKLQTSPVCTGFQAFVD